LSDKGHYDEVYAVSYWVCQFCLRRICDTAICLSVCVSVGVKFRKLLASVAYVCIVLKFCVINTSLAMNIGMYVGLLCCLTRFIQGWKMASNRKNKNLGF